MSITNLNDFKDRTQGTNVEPTLKGDGGGNTFNPMERIAKLEVRADYAEQRLIRIEDKLDRVLEKLGSMPTTNGLWGMIATVIGVGISIAGLTFMIAQHVAK